MSLERISQVLTLVLSALALVGAFEGYTNVNLSVKLFATTAAGAVLAFAVASALAKWIKPKRSTGFTPPQQRPWGRLFASGCALLLAVCVAFTFLSLLQISWFSFQVYDAGYGEKPTTLLVAPSTGVESLTIELPPGMVNPCSWRNETSPSVPQLKIQMIDWNSPVPKLQISNFSYPQRVSIDCGSSRKIENLIVVPSATRIYRNEEVERWKLGSSILGVLTWIAACFALWRWSQ